MCKRGSVDTAAPSASRRCWRGAGLFAAAGDEQAAAKERLALKPVELLTQRDDWADCDEGRRADLLSSGAGRQVLEVGDDRALVGPSAPFNGCGQRRSRSTPSDEMLAYTGEFADGHEDDESAVKGR